MRQLEKPIENAILNFLEFVGFFPWKNNTIGVWDAKRKIYRKPNNKFHRQGVPDIMFVYRGRLIAIEVKAPKGTLRPEQRVFLAKLNDEGAYAFVSRSVQQTVTELSKIMTNPEDKEILNKMKNFNWPETTAAWEQ